MSFRIQTQSDQIMWITKKVKRQMSYAQRYIAMDKMMRSADPESAALAREYTLQRTINALEVFYRLTLRATESVPSLNLGKAKLRAYYAIKQKDKLKCRAAIDAYKEVALDVLQIAMDGKLEVDMHGLEQSYRGDAGKDENARQVAESFKNTADILEYFYDEI